MHRFDGLAHAGSAFGRVRRRLVSSAPRYKREGWVVAKVSLPLSISCHNAQTAYQLDMAPTQLVWLITGTSYVQILQSIDNVSHFAIRSGFGRELVLQILQRGDKVIATARGRSFSKLADLKEQGADTYELDVNAPQDTLYDFAKNVIKAHGRVDVVVNNAGDLSLYHSIGA